MKKPLFRLAAHLQSALRQAAGDSPPPIDWSRLAPRIHLDAWASLYRWDQAGQTVIRINDEAEDAMLRRPLPPGLPLATHPLLHEAAALQMPERSSWIVLARHAPAPCHVALWQQHGWSYAQPVLTYVANDAAGGIMAGYINLADQPTPADLHLIPGRILRADGTMPALTDAEITEEDYRLTLAITALYSRTR